MQLAHIVTLFNAMTMQGHVLTMHVAADLGDAPVVASVIRALQFVAAMHQRTAIELNATMVVTHLCTFMRRCDGWVCGAGGLRSSGKT